MIVQYECQTTDTFFLTAFERHWKQRRIDKYITAVIRVGVTALLLGAVATALQREWGLAFASVCLSALFLSRRSLNRLVLLKNVRKSPYYNEVTKTSLTDDEFLSESSKSSEKANWNAFTRAICFSDGILLYQGPNIFHWLPNSALVEGSTPEQAASVIRERVSDYRQIF
ncbi:MAG: YcxB family protein [Planctomycetes bacterium]|nr:YcxB family protein [Planctomycetota bacterium]